MLTRDDLRNCSCCPRQCHADRAGSILGFCESGTGFSISSICCHHGEEPVLSGKHGICNIFFSHCNMQCLFCQNYQISQERLGAPADADALADTMLSLQAQGCHNINLVSATHFLPMVIRALKKAAAGGLSLPLVFNSNGYERPEVMRLLDGIIDIYLPDAKYGDDETARGLSGAHQFALANGSANLNFVTIANNVTGTEAPGAGSGINTFPSGATAVAVKNVLLAANVKGFVAIADAAFPELYKTVTIPEPGDPESPTLPEYAANCGSSGALKILSNGNNLSSDGSCATTVLTQTSDKNNIDPLIGPLADNNAGTTGTTLTHALPPGSPALSTGVVDPLVTTVDQRGQPRESPPDIGAFELDNIAEGGGGGGCALGGDGRLDPTLPAMLAAALAFFGWRRRPAR